MFNGKETIKRKITIAILTVVSLSFCTQAFAQQQDFTKEEDNFGNPTYSYQRVLPGTPRKANTEEMNQDKFNNLKK